MRQPEFESNRELQRLRGVLAELKLQRASLLFGAALRKFRPDQLRIPAGNPDAGQWADEGGGKRPLVQPVFLPAAPFAADKAIVAIMMLYSLWSSRSSADRRAVVEFNAREFQATGDAEAALEAMGQRTRDEVDALCPRLGEVQERTNAAAAATNRDDYSSAATYGTAVHQNLKEQIEGLRDSNFVAEKSLLKTNEEARYGDKDSIRVDVLENVGDGTVCVYDIKTGKSGLSLARTVEIAENVKRNYSDARRIVVTEVRPGR